MRNDFLFHAGEATVFARDGQFTDAMPEILIGRLAGPVGQAYANLMAQSKGHTAMFAIPAPALNWRDQRRCSCPRSR